MRRLCVLGISLFLALFTLGGETVEATYDCAATLAGGEPLDTHTESRFRRYLRQTSRPRNLTTEEQVRFDYLEWNEFCIGQSRRDRRLNQRDLDIRDRLKLPEKEKEAKAKEPVVFDPEGLGSEPLDSHTENRVLGYVQSDNCPLRNLAEKALMRCVYLLAKKDDIKARALDRRRLRSVQSRMSSVQKKTPSKVSTGVRETAAQADFQSTKEVSRVIDFDPSTHPGRDPLAKPSEEQRVRLRYVENQSCSRAPTPVMQDRCYFLVQQENARQREVTRTDSRLRAKGLIGGAVIRRGVGSNYRRSLFDVNSIIKQRQRYFRPSPRTIREAEENYQAPVVVPGDEN